VFVHLFGQWRLSFRLSFIHVQARADGYERLTFLRNSGPADPRAQHIDDLKSGRSAVRSHPSPRLAGRRTFTSGRIRDSYPLAAVVGRSQPDLG